MSDARRARAKRRAALASRIARTAPVGGRPRHSLSPAVNAATGPAGNEQQASSQHPSMRRDGRTATPSLAPAGSLSRAPRATMEARAALIAANELLHYHPVDDVYEEWIDRVAELVRAAGGSPTPSISLHRAPPCVGNEAPGAPQPPPPQEGALAPRRVPPWAEPAPSGASAARAKLPRNPSPARSRTCTPRATSSRPLTARSGAARTSSRPSSTSEVGPSDHG